MIDEGPFQNILSIASTSGIGATGGTKPTHFKGILDVYLWDEIDLPPPSGSLRWSGCPEDASLYCPGFAPPFVEAVIANYRIELFAHLTPRNFPILIVDTDHASVIEALPAFLCSTALWKTGANERYAGGRRSRFYLDADLLADPDDEPGNYSGGDILNICSESYIPAFRGSVNAATGAQDLDLVLTTATWNITAVSATGGYVDLDAGHLLESGGVVVIEGQPLNNGVYRLKAGTTGARCVLVGLAAEAAQGTLSYPGAALTDSGSYSAVSAPTGLYTPKAIIAGDVLSASDTEDQTLKLASAGVYNGTRTVDLTFTATGVQHVTLTNTTYQGSATGGTWENQAVRLASSDTIPASKSIRLTSTGGGAHYDGEYGPSDYSPESYGLKLIGTFFAGTDSGTIDYKAINMQLDGLPTGYSKEVSMTVTGTTDYNGSYTSVGVTEIIAGIGIAIGGDFEDVYFVSNQSGTYQITSPDTISGNVNLTSGTGPHSFTSGSKDKTGTVTDVESRHARFAVGTHTVQTGWSFSVTTGPVYGGDGGFVSGVGATHIDSRIAFNGTDSGSWVASAPISE